MNRERRALYYALAAVALWSTVATGFKLGLAELRPLQLLWLGSFVSWTFFAALALAARLRRRVGESSAGGTIPYGRAALLGLVSPFAYYIILFEAYDRLPAQIAQPLNYTWAITLAVLAVPLLKQPLTRRMALGILLSYVGVVVLVTRGQMTEFGHFDGFGVALALASTLLWAGYWLATVRLQMASVPLMLVSFSIGTPLVGIACYLVEGLPALSGRNLLFAAWVGLVEMGVTFLLWQRALELTRHAARIGQLIFISPFASLVLISQVLGEAIHPSAVAALALIVIGLIAAQTEST